MAVVADTILAIGTNDDIFKYKGKSTEIRDVRKLFITPGFIDAHVHLLMGGNSLLNVQLQDAKTPEEFTKTLMKLEKSKLSLHILAEKRFTRIIRYKIRYNLEKPR